MSFGSATLMPLSVLSASRDTTADDASFAAAVEPNSDSSNSNSSWDLRDSTSFATNIEHKPTHQCQQSPGCHSASPQGMTTTLPSSDCLRFRFFRFVAMMLSDYLLYV
jgi:hypothetical protein